MMPMLIALWFLVQGTGPVLVPVPRPMLEGMEPVVAQQLGEVRASLDQALSAGTADGSLFGDVGRAYQAYGITDAAEACYRNAEALDGADFRWTYLLGVLLQEDNRPGEAAAAFERVLARRDRYYPAFIRLASVYLSLGQVEKAETTMVPARAHAPDDPAGVAFEGELMLASQRYDAAASLLARAIELQPRATRLHYPLGMALRSLGRLEEARAHLAQAGATGVRPRDPVFEAVLELRRGESTFMVEGHTAYRAGDMRGAATAFRKALEASNGTSVAALTNLAVVEASLGRRDDALAHITRASELEPRSPSVLFNLGILLASRERHSEAAAVFERALAIAPRDQGIRASLGTALLRDRRVGEALAVLDQLTAPDGQQCAALRTALDTLPPERAAGDADRIGRLRARLAALPACAARQ